MTYEQIIKKLQESEISVENFAYEEIPYNIEDYPEALEAKKIREESLKELRDENNNWIEGGYEKYRQIPSEYDVAKQKATKEKLGLIWKEVDQYGGEGQGDTWYSVKYFPDFDIYIRVDGYYSSYNGTDFYGGYKDCCRQVIPQTKTITVYE